MNLDAHHKAVSCAVHRHGLQRDGPAVDLPAALNGEQCANRRGQAIKQHKKNRGLACSGLCNITFLNYFIYKTLFLDIGQV